MCLINLMFNIQAAAPPSIFIKYVPRGMLMGHDVINIKTKDAGGREERNLDHIEN